MDDLGEAAPPGTSAYYVIRFAPAAQRPVLAALFGWRHELIRAATRTSDPGVARAKLHWWREELQRAVAGAGQHPLARPLGEAVRAHALPTAAFDAMIDAAAEDARRTGCASVEALLAYCDRSGGSFGELLARIGGTDPSEGRRLGSAARLVEVLRDLGGDLRRAHCRLPQAEMDRAGLREDQLLDRGNAAAVRDLLPAFGDLARVEGRLSGPAGRWYRLRRLLLDELQAGGWEVLDAKVSITPLRKLWLAWRVRG
jgi:phytoene synthase